MTAKTTDVDYALTSKGFRSEDCTHHRMFWFYNSGKKTTIRTRMSHGSREIDSRLIGCMARDMRLRKDEFLQFVACKMSAGAYLQKMVDEHQVLPAA